MIHPYSANGAQYGCGGSPHFVGELPWTLRLVPVSQEGAKDRRRKRGQLVHIVGLEAAADPQRVPESIDLRDFAGFGIDPVNELRLLVVLIPGLTISAQVA
jgi:hypothetical protein